MSRPYGLWADSMETFGITFGDLVVLGILIIAGLMGLALGLVKAILFVASWVGAGLITLYTYEHIKPYFAEFLEKQLYADIAAAASVFIVSLILLFWFCSLIWRAVRKSEFSGLDRSLGLLGGLFVGVFLVCIAYLGATWMWGEDDLPSAIGEARARPYVQVGTDMIRTFLPGKTQEKAKTTVGDTQRRIKDAMETERAMRRLLGQPSEGEQTPPDKQKGYATPSRRDMDRLFESKQ